MPPHPPQNLKPYITAAVFNFLLISYANKSFKSGKYICGCKKCKNKSLDSLNWHAQDSEPFQDQ